eukprot:tig00021580_g22597.t1
MAMAAALAHGTGHPMIEQINSVTYRIKKGFVPNMRVEGRMYVNERLAEVVFEELQSARAVESKGGFLSAPNQVANVAALDGILGASLAMPDIHSGYGFAIGNVAAFDMDDEKAVVSPGGVGYDINCGVRLIRTNLSKADVEPHRERLTDLLYKAMPVGVGGRSAVLDDVYAERKRREVERFKLALEEAGDAAALAPPQLKKSDETARELDEILARGMEWSLEHGHAWPEDLEHCEEGGRLRNADPGKVSGRAKARGVSQIGTLGAGNHYAEIQFVDEIFDEAAARAMGITFVGQVVVMLHCGSRGLGHQVATDALQARPPSPRPPRLGAPGEKKNEIMGIPAHPPLSHPHPSDSTKTTHSNAFPTTTSRHTLTTSTTPTSPSQPNSIR